MDTIRIDNPEVLTREDRIQELEEELSRLRENPRTSRSTALLRLLEKPEQIRDSFNLNEEQAVNVRAIITGAGTGLSVKYLSKSIGTELSGVLGALLSAYISRKVFGK